MTATFQPINVGKVCISNVPISDKKQSALPYLIEELVCCSIREIVIPGNTFAAQFVDTLHESHKAWIRVVDDDQAFKLSEHVLRLLKQDVCTNPDKWWERPDYYDFITPKMEKAIEKLAYHDIPVLMMGFVHQSAVPISASIMRDRLALIRPVLRNPEIRLIFAGLEGIIATYKSVTSDGIYSVSSDEGYLAERLEFLLKDDQYKEMTHQSFLLGLPEHLDSALGALRFLAGGLIKNDRVRRWFTVGTRVLEAATTLPLTDSDFTNALTGKKFLPPFVIIDEPWNRAFQRFWRCDILKNNT